MSDTITITGNIATQPEIKRTAGGVTITSFRVASALRRYDRATETWVDNGTNWYTASMFRTLAEHAFHSLNKGDRVLLSGRLRLRQWDNGTKQGMTAEIDVEAIGHDLLWGTSSFQRDGGQPPSAATPPVGPAGGWAASEIDAAASGFADELTPEAFGAPSESVPGPDASAPAAEWAVSPLAAADDVVDVADTGVETPF